MATEATIRAAIVGVLEAGLEDLAIDSRGVTVWTRLPEQAFKQRGLWPLVLVERPQLQSQEWFDSANDREVWQVEVWVGDQFKPSEEDMEACEGRLAALRDSVKQVLDGTPYLGLEALAVMPGFWDFGGVGSYEMLGNNAMMGRVVMTVPVVVARG